MIQILDYSYKLKRFLSSENIKIHLEKFKIFLRLDFSIDVYIVSKDVNSFGKDFFSREFSHSLDAKEELIKVRIRFKVFSLEELKDGFFEGLFSSNEPIVFGSRFRLDTFFKSNTSGKAKNQVPIVTFYSYKGGMGRTTALIFYAYYLALQGKKVFIIDCDLEAPGYLNFFDLSKHSGLKSGNVNGLVEFFCDIQFAKDANDLSIWKYIINIAQQNEKIVSWNDESSAFQNIYLMPAGNLNENLSDVGVSNYNRRGYLEGLSRLNLADEIVTKNCFETLFSKVLDKENGVNPDVILIDSRTGFNDIIGTAVQYFTDILVGFFGSNEQTTPGLLTLLDSYKDVGYKLLLINSILPAEQSDDMFNHFKEKVIDYLGDLGSDQSYNLPLFLPLHRVNGLEKIGVKNLEPPYLQQIKENSIPEYCELFDSINDSIWPQDDSQEQEQPVQPLDVDVPAVKIPETHTMKRKPINVSTIGTWALRNRILQNLKIVLAETKTFAENAEIKEEYFFYRNCMNELFDKHKYLIRGYKGTGKTYLYKALADPNSDIISKNIRVRANKQREKEGRPRIDDAVKVHFVDMISIGAGDKSFDFENLDIDKVQNPNFYFKRIWQIHTWNSILLDPMFDSIRRTSKLAEKIQIIKGDTAVNRFSNMISEGLSVFVDIENDMQRINDFLVKNNIQLFILYDQLDTKIKPIYWDKVVSPLINYWRDNWEVYSNIFPKIFVRTDLFRRITGTNTEMLDGNITKIEWTIDEIFSYFFKLVVAIEPDNFWEIMKRPGRIGRDSEGKYAKMIPGYKKEFEDNNNQIATLSIERLTPLVNTFFGSRVVPPTNKSIDLGSPYDYFKITLSNADRDSISLRPFINTLDKNAVEIALKALIPERHVTSIISSNVYADRNVRIRTANSYFDDLAKDQFSKDLYFVRDYVNSDKGESYRYKTLTEKQFYEMLNDILFLNKMSVVSNQEDMITLLKANGIVSDKIERGEKVWRWAPMYAYAWKLKSTRFDKNDRKSYMSDFDGGDD